MWILRGPKGEEHYLTSNKVHVVSRKAHGDIVLAGDESVSRTHAKLEVTFDKEHVDNPAYPPKVFLIECNSKYGTYVNKGISTNSRIPEGTRLMLKDGDRVRFGIQHNEWKLHHIPLIVTTSTLSAEQKLRLSEKIAELGGHVVQDWQDDCTHVTMNKIMLTVKVVCALARGRHIVAPDYWEHYLSAATGRSELPDHNNHVPPLAERSLSSSKVSFAVDERRASLFKGKLFVFHSVEQHTAFSCMVFSAGGLCVIAEGCGMSTEEMLEPHVIVMGYPFERGSQDTQLPDAFIKLKSFLMSKRKRLISESEIGLAILHCSTERYCNPQFWTESSSTANQSQAMLTRNTIMRATQEGSQPGKKPSHETQSEDSFPSLRTKKRNKIAAIVSESDSESSSPESLDVPAAADKETSRMATSDSAEPEETTSRKRIRSVVDFVETPSKRIATELHSVNHIPAAQTSVNILPKAKSVAQDNSLEVNTFRTKTVDKEVFLSESGHGRNNVSHSLNREKHVSRRKSESSDEEEPLFSFVGDPKKPATTRRRNDSDDKGTSMFTFLDEPEADHASSRKRTVGNKCDSDEDDAASKFAFVEDSGAKFAETFFPDKTWTSGTKRPIQEVSSPDNFLVQPPAKRPSIETSRKKTKQIVNLEDFISAVNIKDKGTDDSNYLAGLPEYVQAMNNTVIVTVGASVICSKARQECTINQENVSNAKNFKKFKKVNSVRSNIVPTIIGGTDLIVANNNTQQHAVNGEVDGLDARLESTFNFVDD